MVRCAECRRTVRKYPVTVVVDSRTVKTYGPTCARKLGYSKRRHQTAVKSLTSTNTATRSRTANTRQTTYVLGEVMDGQLELFTLDDEGGQR